MSETANPSKHFLSEAELFRRLDLPGRRGVKLRDAGIIVPDLTLGGRVRLYAEDRLTEFKAKLANPQPVAA